ncbi:MAG TPA: FHA domain-containing protein [Deltaproteobacteria bacterium]|nr:FHA domain-containing protein [Deltaproteobacteria bacterium]
MDKAELLASFTERVDQFDRYQSFISKAQEQSGKFAAAVVEKVVADNESKSMEVVSELVPLMADIEAIIEDLRAQRAEALDSSKESQFRLEELELRLAIGDLSEKDFNAEASEFKGVVDSTETKVAELDGERVLFEEALSRWHELGTSAGVLANGASQPNGAHHADDPAGYDDYSHQPELDADLDYEAQPMPEPDIVLEADPGADPIETFDVAGDDLGFEDALVDDNAFEVDDLDLVESDNELDLGDSGSDFADDKDKPRRAVLLYQEGTAEEQIYPFTGEMMSLGRGRDNEVQVKNDSKVSRYHCKLYRRGPNFYIEDNKSANGTLVNGELITERRLFGGEEVIIGETFFRFRILD